ncbi:hypothetical protein CPB83DRAFT_846739 [Crepidotus variabilis]|uniref:Nephrocystin 3-like N-terminal domain-containing protein n=1 Tax=Crepidotus variabilis TaxID=179855 RepID=A0A9P6EQS7_9AGAR|nr:hypothetical protein CPB83DRAFT_846739 [Crepidotus variabilis]
MESSAGNSSASTTFIQNAENTAFHGGNFTVAGVVNNLVSQVRLGTASPIDLLLAYCALDALVNSNERYDPPKCAPDTRDAIISEIIEWAKSNDQAPSVLWIFGSAGAGKSAVCQTVAEHFLQKQALLGSFFFSRVASTSGRSNGDRLIPTLVYQLFQALPEVRPKIEREIRINPAVLQKSRLSQMAVLFIKPLQAFSWRKIFRNLSRKQIRLVVIDGLDECQDPEIQCDLLRTIASAAAELSLPLRFLISSRPEAHINQTFDHPRYFKGVSIRRVNLDKDPTAPIAIMTFLRGQFQEIHETHPLRQHLDSSWPGEHNLELLVAKSSPQFVYASTVMNYVQSKKHLPSVRLDAILAMANSSQQDFEDRPLDELDKLYRFIFFGVDERHRADVWCLLGIMHLAGKKEFAVPQTTLPLFERIFNIHPGVIRIILEPLFSVLSVPEDSNTVLKSLHASLFDFLLDPHRSGSLSLDLKAAHLLLLRYYSSESFGSIKVLSLYKDIMRHAKWVDPTSETRELVDCMLVHLFTSLFWNNSGGDFETLNDAFTILTISTSVRDADTTAWLSRRLKYYQECLPDFAPPKEPSFESTILQTKHCIFWKMIQHYYHPGCNQTAFLSEYNLWAFTTGELSKLLPYIHMAAAFAANSQLKEWFDFVHSVGYIICGRATESDEDVDLVLGCRSLVLKALHEEPIEKTERYAKVLRLWSNIRLNGRVITCHPGSDPLEATAHHKVNKTARFLESQIHDRQTAYSDI